MNVCYLTAPERIWIEPAAAFDRFLKAGRTHRLSFIPVIRCCEIIFDYNVCDAASKASLNIKLFQFAPQNLVVK